MKKIIGFVFLFVSVTVFAQNKIAEDIASKPAITAIGKPDGEKTTMKIGKDGGSFTSSDGKIRLIIPEGAVSKKTTFSIQPTTNLMPNGNGKAYDMEPSGINFNKSLQLIYYYTDDDTEGNSPLLMGMAMQDEKGKWFSLNKTVLDSLAKTLTTAIHHFSAYVNFSKAKISPASARVKVNGTRRLQIVGAFWDDTDDDAELLPLGIVEYPNMNWSVNGIPSGNSSIGIISASQSGSAIFQAPAQIPQQNPVAVTAQQQFSASFLFRYGVTKLVSKITIYDDAYEVKMVSAIIGGSPQAWGGIVTNRDEGSFIVSLEKNKPAVINIKNQMEVMTDNCQKTILNPNSNTGIFHVAGARQIKITPANPPGQPYPIVEIFFIPYPIELTRFKFICPPPPSARETVTGKIDLSQMAMMVFYGKPALPQYIKFIAKDEEQIILESPPGVREIYYKISVKKVREE
ncbi:hypothetical protein [Ferruginibacter sp.]